MDDFQTKYQNLLYNYRTLQVQNESMEMELCSLKDKLRDAQWTIDRELTPRLEREARSYDSWVLSGGSDTCMRNGMNGNCGVGCDSFGDIPECFEGFSDEDLINIRREGEDAVDQAIIDRGLSNRLIEIEIEEYRDLISTERKLLKRYKKALRGLSFKYLFKRNR